MLTFKEINGSKIFLYFHISCIKLKKIFQKCKQLKSPTSRYRLLSFPTVHIFEPFTLFCQFREKKEIWTFSHMLLEEVRYFPISKTAVIVKLTFAIVSYYSRSVVASVVIIIIVVKIVIVVVIRY